MPSILGIKKNWKYNDLIRTLLLFSLVLLWSITTGWGRESGYVIRGTIKASNGQPSFGATIELKRIIMAEKPTIETVHKTTSDEQGRYLFKIIKVEPRIFFRIDITSGKVSTGSNPLKFGNQQSEIVADFTLPGVSEKTDHLSILKNIFVFDLLNQSVQVTEIINIENSTGLMIDTRNVFMEKSIPESAFEFNFLKKQEGFNIYAEPGRIIFKLIVPEGQHQLYFSYNIPVNQDELLFETSLLPNTTELELIVPENGLSVLFQTEDFQQPHEIVRKDQFYGNRLYHSQRLLIKKPVKAIRVEIAGFPLSPNRLIYPAAFLALLLLTGLFWFMVSKYRPGLRT